MLDLDKFAKIEIVTYRIIGLFLIIYFTTVFIFSLINLEKNNNAYYCYDWGKEKSEECSFGQALANDFGQNFILLPFHLLKHS